MRTMKSTALGIVLIVGFFAASAIGCYGQENRIATETKSLFLTGKDWNPLPETAKVYLIAGYLAGYDDARRQESDASLNQPALRACYDDLRRAVKPLPPLVVAEWQAGLDRFYSVPDNMNVWFEFAVEWVWLKALGMKPEVLAELEKSYRRESKMLLDALPHIK